MDGSVEFAGGNRSDHTVFFMGNSERACADCPRTDVALCQTTAGHLWIGGYEIVQSVYSAGAGAAFLASVAGAAGAVFVGVVGVLVAGALVAAGSATGALFVAVSPADFLTGAGLLMGAASGVSLKVRSCVDKMASVILVMPKVIAKPTVSLPNTVAADRWPSAAPAPPPNAALTPPPLPD